MTMVKRKVSELEGAQLDWAVAVAMGCTAKMNRHGGVDTTQQESMRLGIPGDLFHGAFGHGSVRFRPSTYWSQGGPIIERERIPFCPVLDGMWISEFVAWEGTGGRKVSLCGPTPLIAAMRAFVARKLGEEVECPT